MFNPILQKNITAIQSIESTLSGIQIKKRLDEFRIDIVVDSPPLDNSNIMDTLWVTLNLLPRIFSGVRLVGDPNFINNFPPSHRDLINIGEKDWNASLVIKLGVTPIKTDTPVLYAGSCGWTAYLSSFNPCPYPVEPQNPIGAILAGALVTGEAFKIAFSDLIDVRLCTDLTYDPLSHGTDKAPLINPEIPKEIYFEDVTLIGAGAVGMSIILCLSKLPRLMGKLRIIDHEQTDESNEQRYILSFKENRGNPKALMVSNYMSQLQPLLSTQGMAMLYEIYTQLSDSNNVNLPLVMVTVDSEKTRKNVQAGLPKTILNGWTETEGNNMAYGVGKHEFIGPYECLACSYFPKSAPADQEEFYSMRTGFTVEEVRRRLKENIQTTPKDIEFIAKNTGVDIKKLLQFVGKPLDEVLHGSCGIFTIPIPGIPATAPVPHIPLLVAIHLVTQLLIPYLEMTPEIKLIESAAIFSGLGIPNINNLELRKKNPQCICSDPIYQEAHKTKWNG